ncbi:response regulator transcription factor [Poseidonibacter lekithochrous]|uniref:response regulator transcription factor n=1 Tax=Poseidonibacter lekithochrous TaxID=1904463 RepID=UPI0009FA6C04|nr:response regulator transcription factor [Poseidonibacter lekithochrous]QKJ23991.1 two-component system response regulator [Poseidonibacter lekithochrous]
MNDLTLLYVEDDLEALEDVVYLLKRYFSNIYTATDGEEALELFSAYSPDIVLLDINIPKINGLQVASKIKEINDEIPILFLTAHSETEKLLKAIDLRAISYIIKPFSIEELNESIVKTIKMLNKQSLNNNILTFTDSFSWNIELKELSYKDEKLDLTKNEILLIELLINNKSRFLTAQDISEMIFPDKQVESNSIVQLISRFKNKVAKQTNLKRFFIENIYSQGYRIK